MAKITYINKQQAQPNPIAIDKQWTFGDANEVKNVVNNNADELKEIQDTYPVPADFDASKAGKFAKYNHTAGKMVFDNEVVPALTFKENAQSISGTFTIDMEVSNLFVLTMTGNVVLEYSNIKNGTYILMINNTSNHTLTFGSGFSASNGVAFFDSNVDFNIIQLISVNGVVVVSILENILPL